jgi:hypothetical protein
MKPAMEGSDALGQLRRTMKTAYQQPKSAKQEEKPAAEPKPKKRSRRSRSR